MLVGLSNLSTKVMFYLPKWFALMTALQVWSENVITGLAIDTDVRNETMVIVLVQISLPIDSQPRLSDVRTTQTVGPIASQTKILSPNFTLTANLMIGCDMEALDT